MPYNPFDVSIGEPLTPDELQQLVTRRVAEGYFVEYKGIMPAKDKIGHSIASFANTYGGWYIVGVTTDGHNVATDIKGFAPALCPDPISVVREITKTHISPLPIIEPQVVTLDNGHLVVVVHIPEGQDTPFISKDGRIYRRVADSSDPIPEKDRYAIDRLVDQGKVSQEHFASFCRDERTFSNGESKRRWVGIYLQPYPYGCVDCRDKVRSLDALEQALSLSKATRTILIMRAQSSDDDADSVRLDGPDPLPATAIPTGSADVTASGNLPFTMGFITSRSLLLRQINRSHVGCNANISMELCEDGGAKIFFELSDVNPLADIHQTVQKGNHSTSTLSNSVREALETYVVEEEGIAGITLARFFDITQLWTHVLLLVTYYQAWLGAQPTMQDVVVAISLSGVWRSVGFLDDDRWAEYIQKYGLPILDQDQIWIPGNVRHAPILPCDDRLWLLVCGLLHLGLGIPVELLGAAIEKVQLISKGEQHDAPA